MPRELRKGSSGLVGVNGVGSGIPANIDPLAGALATAGAGTLTVGVLAGDLVYRTGPAGAYTDTSDTAANIEASFGAGMDIGDSKLIMFSNQVAQVATIAGGTGVTLSSTKSTIAASTVGWLLLKKTGAGANAAYNLYVL